MQSLAQAMNPEKRTPGDDISRREALATMTILTSGLALSVEEPAAAAPGVVANTINVRLSINGSPFHAALDPRVTLLDLLRERLQLTGTKKGCDHGQCGACTVLANGRRINSCLSLAATHEGEEITTIESLSANGKLHPLQSAFIDHDGFQCGYCTPGQICSAVGLIGELKRGEASVLTPDLARTGAVAITDDELRERMSGNICRCGAYPGIVAAVRQVAGTTVESSR